MAIHKPGINRLHQWTEVFGKIFHIHHLCIISNFPPLQIAVISSWKISKGLTFLLNQHSGYMWGSHFEPRSIPKYWLKSHRNFFSLSHFSCSVQEDFSSI